MNELKEAFFNTVKWRKSLADEFTQRDKLYQSKTLTNQTEPTYCEEFKDKPKKLSKDGWRFKSASSTGIKNKQIWEGKGPKKSDAHKHCVF